MGELKQIEIKNRIYYFYYGMINLKNFEPNLLKIEKKSLKKHCYLQRWIYYN